MNEVYREGAVLLSKDGNNLLITISMTKEEDVDNLIKDLLLQMQVDRKIHILMPTREFISKQ